LKLIKKFHPIEQKVEFKNGSNIKCKFKPNITLNKFWKKELKKSTLELEFDHQFKDDNVEVVINVNGEVFKLISGEGDSDFNISFKATKHF
jgi:hypothetical protein